MSFIKCQHLKILLARVRTENNLSRLLAWVMPSNNTCQAHVWEWRERKGMPLCSPWAVMAMMWTGSYCWYDVHGLLYITMIFISRYTCRCAMHGLLKLFFWQSWTAVVAAMLHHLPWCEPSAIAVRVCTSFHTCYDMQWVLWQVKH